MVMRLSSAWATVGAAKHGGHAGGREQPQRPITQHVLGPCSSSHSSLLCLLFDARFVRPGEPRRAWWHALLRLYKVP